MHVSVSLRLCLCDFGNLAAQIRALREKMLCSGIRMPCIQAKLQLHDTFEIA